MKIDDIFKALHDSYPFIYKTEKMGYKYIGSAVYRDCTTDERTLFENYWKEINELHHLTYEPNEEDVRKLVEILSQILKLDDFEYSDEKAKMCSEKLWKCLQLMSLPELEALSEQREYFLDVVDYKDKAFYRHSRK